MHFCRWLTEFLKPGPHRRLCEPSLRRVFLKANSLPINNVEEDYRAFLKQFLSITDVTHRPEGLYKDQIPIVATFGTFSVR